MWTGRKRSSWCARDTGSTGTTGEWTCSPHIFHPAAPLKRVKSYVDVGEINEKSHYSFGTGLGATLALLSGVTHTFLDNYPSACYWFPAVEEGVGGWVPFGLVDFLSDEAAAGEGAKRGKGGRAAGSGLPGGLWQAARCRAGGRDCSPFHTAQGLLNCC